MKRAKGFTLLELLLVIVVIGYLVSLVRLPSLGDDPFETVEKQAQRLTHQINLASEFAVLNGAEMGLALTETEYQFLVYDGEKWLPVTEEPFMRLTTDENIQLELKLDGLTWQEENLLSAIEFIDEEQLEQEQEEQTDKEDLKLQFPQVFILSSGEVSAFDILVQYNDGFSDTIDFLIRGKFTAPVALYDPLQQMTLED